MAKAGTTQDKKVVADVGTTGIQGDGLQLNTQEQTTGIQGEGLQPNTQELTTGTQGEGLQLNTQEQTTGIQGEGLQLNTQEQTTGTQGETLQVNTNHPSWLIGAFDVKARAQSGFWRCGIHFLNSSATRVFVVTSKAEVPADHQCSVSCCYLTAEEAQRVYNEPWLTVLSDSTATLD